VARFSVYVVPRSPRPGPDGRHGGVPRLRVAAPASDGRANREAERVLSELLNSAIALTGGQRSRRKVFETDLGETELDDRMRRAFGD
jgi:uncharacterized protein YggU (UPF0235/DUF167 family)